MPEPSVSKLPGYALRAVGVAAIAMAGLGLWYSAVTMNTRFPPDSSTPYFAPAVYTMSAIWVACYISLLVAGIQLVRLKTWWVRPFVGVVMFEIALNFAPVLLYFGDSGIVRSIASAHILTLGGMVFQLVTLFVVWGPLLALWARKRIEDPRTYNDPFAYRERIARTTDWLWAGVNFIIVLSLGLLAINLLWIRAHPGTMAPGGLKAPAAKFERRRQDRIARGLCGRCEYDMTGNTSGVCPECGAHT